ncbi:hypothetical protein SO802_023097 [Lithocarpus litseifolius]|uniref:Uncharacterized protein n=1 Tax=Lithocarpus litseifolius TaxID=425828 RepID=A0AAW2C974_9ROSI
MFVLLVITDLQSQAAMEGALSVTDLRRVTDAPGVILARARQNVATALSYTLDLSAQPAVTRPVLTQPSPNILNAGMKSSL